MEFVAQLVFFLLLLMVGLVFGRAAEKRHFKAIERQERALKDILIFNERRLPPDTSFSDAKLVVGSVVIAEDYFKRIAAALRGLVGGRVTVYESLMDRGRREAIIRMKNQARGHGATLVFNVRFETSSLSEAARGTRPLFSAEFIAYGTALVP